MKIVYMLKTDGKNVTLDINFKHNEPFTFSYYYGGNIYYDPYKKASAITNAGDLFIGLENVIVKEFPTEEIAHYRAIQIEELINQFNNYQSNVKEKTYTELLEEMENNKINQKELKKEWLCHLKNFLKAGIPMFKKPEIK